MSRGVQKETRQNLEDRIATAVKMVEFAFRAEPNARVLIVGHRDFFKHMIKDVRFWQRGTSAEQRSDDEAFNTAGRLNLHILSHCLQPEKKGLCLCVF